jgi:hypothetical protein
MIAGGPSIRIRNALARHAKRIVVKKRGVTSIVASRRHIFSPQINYVSQQRVATLYA